MLEGIGLGAGSFVLLIVFIRDTLYYTVCVCMRE